MCAARKGGLDQPLAPDLPSLVKRSSSLATPVDRPVLVGGVPVRTIGVILG